MSSLKNPVWFPREEGGEFRLIASGFLVLMSGIVALYVGNVRVAHVLSLMAGQGVGSVTYGAVLGVVVHGSQTLLLLFGWLLTAQGFSRHFTEQEPFASLLNFAVAAAGIGVTWTALPLLSENLRVVSPLRLSSVILLTALFQILTRRVENEIDKGAALLLWVYSFQSLELLPVFSTDAHAFLEGSDGDSLVAALAGIALFLSFMMGAVLSSWLLARYSSWLNQVRRLWELEMPSVPKEDLLEINMVDMRNLVHDLKNPLAALKGTAAMLRDEEAGRGRPSEKAEVMLKAADYMERMIGEILCEEERRTVSAGIFFKNLERHVRPFPWGGEVKLTTGADAENFGLRLNEIRFTRALVGLLDNASRANRTAGSVGIGLHVRRLHASFLEIEITDNGPGVSSPVFQKSGWGSSGLGLAFARRVITAHGGEILLMNREGASGARVRITLPSAEVLSDPVSL